MWDFKVLDARVAEDRAEWKRLWESWPGREVFAHPDYVRLFARQTDRPLCATLGAQGGRVLFPFILRPLGAEPWASLGEAAWDLVCPYGYGGAFCWNFPASSATVFDQLLNEWLRAQDVICSFARLSLFPEQVLPFYGSVQACSPNIVRSLDLTPDELWQDYEHKVRKNVKRAQQSHLTVEIDSRGERLEEFLAVYYSTLDRREASNNYYFAREFFEAIVRDLRDQFVFVHILQGATLISTELALVSAQHAYSFLGGTLAQAFALRPNDLLKHELIHWARQAGKRAFVLGGGYAGEDGIYRYKKAFAPAGTVTFSVGKAIHDVGGYQQRLQRRQTWELKQGRIWQPQLDYFPEYRAAAAAAGDRLVA